MDVNFKTYSALSGIPPTSTDTGTITYTTLGSNFRFLNGTVGADTSGTTTLLTRITGAVPTLAQMFAQPMQGCLTFMQTQNLQSALLYDATRSVNGAVTTLTWFARKADTNNAGNTLPDLTRPVMVKTTTYSNALLLSITSQAVVIYPANLN